MNEYKYIVEITRKHSAKSYNDIIEIAINCLRDKEELLANTVITVNSDDIEEINICNDIPLKDVNTQWIQFFVYKLNESTSAIEILIDTENEWEEITALNHSILPCREFHGLWNNLIFEDGIKEDLLNFAKTTVKFSQKHVNSNIITCNRIILLHGPPGTGKTSLSKALAQKISIQLGDVYKRIHFLEINSHSLFSKWFSESGKLVMKLFAKIQEFIEHPNALVCVLIDEVESIAISRGSISDNEPSDCLRAVNALLTQLDHLKKNPNVLIFTTSNLTSTIDAAFLDRADIKQFIGNPSVIAIKKMFQSAIEELVRVGLIEMNSSANLLELMPRISNSLNEIAKLSTNLSGRCIRKLPFITFALYLSVYQAKVIPIGVFLDALKLAVGRCHTDLNLIKT